VHPRPSHQRGSCGSRGAQASHWRIRIAARSPWTSARLEAAWRPSFCPRPRRRQRRDIQERPERSFDEQEISRPVRSMNRSGVLLDTGPLVALLSKDDREHDRARRLFATCEPPLRTCESVIAEACFLMRPVDASGPAEIIALGRKGLYTISMSLEDHWDEVESLLRKYRSRAIALAAAWLIPCGA